MAISRNIVENRKIPGQGTGPVGMNEPTFRMQMPRLASVLDRMAPMPDRMPMPMPRFPMPDRMPGRPAPMPMPTPMPNPGPRRPMPMPLPAPDFGLPPRNFGIPPGGGPFAPERFPDQMPRGRQGIMESVAVDPSDYRTILKLIDAGLDPNDYVQQASMAYDDDDYGPFIPPSVIEMDRFGTDYGPQDEYLFDKEKGFENRIFGMDPNYMNRGGITSLLE